MRIKGIYATKRVFVDGRELSPKTSQELRNHSPDGFNWSYTGSGCAQLALSLLIINHSYPTALKHYQALKNELIAKLPKADFEVDFNLTEWTYTMEQIEMEKNRESFYKTFSTLEPPKDFMGHQIDIP